MRPMFSPVRALLVSLILAWSSGPKAGAAIVSTGPLSAAMTGQGPYGTIKGRLVWGGPEAPAPKVLVEQGKAAKDPEVCAKGEPIASRDLVVDPQNKGVANGFVFLVKPKGTNPDAAKELLTKHPKVEIDQKNCEFIPYVLAIHQDQVLFVKSSDPVNHNVRYAAFTNSAVNKILAPGGEMEVRLVAERRPILLTCDIHSWMKAYLMVFDHPFFAVTGPDGSFEIRGVPAGEQNLVLWQEKVGYVNAEKAKGTPVSVKAGETTDVGAVAINPSQVN